MLQPLSQMPILWAFSESAGKGVPPYVECPDTAPWKTDPKIEKNTSNLSSAFPSLNYPPGNDDISPASLAQFESIIFQISQVGICDSSLEVTLLISTAAPFSPWFSIFSSEGWRSFDSLHRSILGIMGDNFWPDFSSVSLVCLEKRSQEQFFWKKQMGIYNDVLHIQYPIAMGKMTIQWRINGTCLGIWVI